VIRLEIQYYLTSGGESPYLHWLNGLRDHKAAGLASARLNRISLGNLGDCKALGAGLMELRIDHGPGYRIYFTFHGKKLVIVFAAGSKRTQDRDIKKARDYLSDYQRRIGAKNG